MRPILVPSVLVLTIFLLCIALTDARCFTNWRPYPDVRCYVEIVNHRYLLRACPAGEYVNPATCYIERKPSHVKTEHRTDCDHALRGEAVYVSWSDFHTHKTTIKTTTPTPTTTTTPTTKTTTTTTPTTTATTTTTTTTAATTTTPVQDHDTCYRSHSYYRDIFDNAKTENCFSPYYVFTKLDYLRKVDLNCLSTLVHVMTSLNLPSCGCSGTQISYPYRGDSSNTHYYTCRNNQIFQEVMNTYLTDQPQHSGGSKVTAVNCHSRNKVWKDLLRLLNDGTECFVDFVYQMDVAYFYNHEPSCQNACQSSGTTQSQSTSTQSTNHQLSQSEKYEAYKKGECLSEHTLWSFLYYEDRYPEGLNRKQLIQKMAALYPSSSDDKCTCTKSFDLHYNDYGTQDNTALSCSRNTQSSAYRGAISHLLDHMNFLQPAPQRCQSHASVWRELNDILQNNHDGERCVENLIHHLYGAVYQQGDPCSCHAEMTTKPTTQSTTTTQSPTTNMTTTTTAQAATNTTLPPSTNATMNTTTVPTTTISNVNYTTNPLQTTTTNNTTNTTSTPSNSTSSGTTTGQATECSKIKTVTELAKYQQLYPNFNSDCSSHISTSNLIVRDLCSSVPSSKFWKPGTKVVDACDTLLPYTPVATFSSFSYPIDGLAGIFLGCTDKFIKIAAQECGGKFEILEFSRHSNHLESFTHTSSNYYTITY